MNRCIMLMAGIFCVGCVGGQSSSATATSTAADSSAIAALEGRLQAAALAANWDAWAAEYTTDPVRFPPNAAPLVGKAAVDAFNRTTPHFSAFTVTLGSVIVRNDVATATGNYTAATAATKDATGKMTPAMNEQGKWMQLLLKQADGSWKISKDIWNSNLPVLAAATASPK